MNPTFDALMSAMGFNRMTCKDCDKSMSSIKPHTVFCAALGGIKPAAFCCEHFKQEAK